MTRQEAIAILESDPEYVYSQDCIEAHQMAVKALKADPKEIFYDGYAYCLLDFGRDIVLCRDCKHYKQSAVADRKMCFRKDVDGIEVCYDFLPDDSCTYGERMDGREND